LTPPDRPQFPDGSRLGVDICAVPAFLQHGRAASSNPAGSSRHYYQLLGLGVETPLGDKDFACASSGGHANFAKRLRHLLNGRPGHFPTTDAPCPPTRPRLLNWINAE
jgi:hypothetical protein